MRRGERPSPSPRTLSSRIITLPNLRPGAHSRLRGGAVSLQELVARRGGLVATNLESMSKGSKAPHPCSGGLLPEHPARYTVHPGQGPAPRRQENRLFILWRGCRWPCTTSTRMGLCLCWRRHAGSLRRPSWQAPSSPASSCHRDSLTESIGEMAAAAEKEKEKGTEGATEKAEEGETVKRDRPAARKYMKRGGKEVCLHREREREREMNKNCVLVCISCVCLCAT